MVDVACQSPVENKEGDVQDGPFVEVLILQIHSGAEVEPGYDALPFGSPLTCVHQCVQVILECYNRQDPISGIQG